MDAQVGAREERRRGERGDRRRAHGDRLGGRARCRGGGRRGAGPRGAGRGAGAAADGAAGRRGRQASSRSATNPKRAARGSQRAIPRLRPSPTGWRPHEALSSVAHGLRSAVEPEHRLRGLDVALVDQAVEVYRLGQPVRNASQGLVRPPILWQHRRWGDGSLAAARRALRDSSRFCCSPAGRPLPPRRRRPRGAHLRPGARAPTPGPAAASAPAEPVTVRAAMIPSLASAPFLAGSNLGIQEAKRDPARHHALHRYRGDHDAARGRPARRRALSRVAAPPSTRSAAASTSPSQPRAAWPARRS